MGSTIGIIQARMGSERLPGKILAPLAGRPALALLVERIRAARVDQWWLATTSEPADDVTEAWGFELGLRVFRGHRTDVLSRFLAIVSEAEADWVVRVTADNPFLDSKLVDALLDARDGSEDGKAAEAVRLEGGLPLSAPTARTAAPTASGDTADPAQGERDDAAPGPARSPRLPLGYGVELVRGEALARAGREIPADAPHHRVHVTSWLHGRARVHPVPTPGHWPERPDWRFTVDTYEDLAMARSAFRVFGDAAGTIDYPAMVAILDEHPEITAMNRHVVQKKLEEG